MIPTSLSPSEVINIILTLLLIFQWYKSHAHEAATTNGIAAVRRMVLRTRDVTAPSILDALDGTLATMGSRKPFLEHGWSLVVKVRAQFTNELNVPVADLPVPSPKEFTSTPKNKK